MRGCTQSAFREAAPFARLGKRNAQALTARSAVWVLTRRAAPCIACAAQDYPNTNALVAELGLQERDVFTDFTTSAFYSPHGLEATAPVFAGAPLQLPSPLGQVFASFDNFKRLPLADRATMAGLLAATLDMQRDAESFAAYDRMTAHELCIRCGLSQRLVDDFVRPTLAVGLFAPLEQLSAAVALELLYFYAFAHQDSFDVRWIARDSIAQLLVAPLAQRLQEQHGVRVLPRCRAEGVAYRDGRVEAVRYTDGDGAAWALDDIDAVVLAVGAKGMRAIVAGSPELAAGVPELAAAASLGAIDVVTTRIWLDRVVPTPHPANVLSRFPQLRGAGGTFFMLDQACMQGGSDDAMRKLWGMEAGAPLPSSGLGSVVAADFYFSGAISLMSDDAIVALLMDELLPAAVPAFAGAKAVDSFVLRCPAAVSHFSPGSAGSRPPLRPFGASNVACAGDWVRMGDREHGAKGLCQERALVSGYEAANSLLRDGALRRDGAARRPHPVLPVRPDEPQVELGRSMLRSTADAARFLGLPPSPWVR
jgi:uncharacterized protein with NAD-binding domain and iron-sulfur cluster